MDMSNLNLLMGSAPMGMCRMCCTDTCRCNRGKSNRNTIIPPKSRPRSTSRPKSKSRPQSKSRPPSKSHPQKPQGKHFPLESSDNGTMMVPTQPPNVNPPPPTLTANQPQQALFTGVSLNQPQQGLFTGVPLNQPQQPPKPMYSEYVNQYDMYNSPPPPPPPKPSSMMNTTPQVNPAINRWYDNVDEWYNDLRLWHNTVDVMTKCNNQQRRLIHELERRQAHMLNGMKYEKMPRPIVKSIRRSRRHPIVPIHRHPITPIRRRPDVVQNCTYKCVKPRPLPPPPKKQPIVIPPPKKRPVELPPTPKPLTPRPGVSPPQPQQPIVVVTKPRPHPRPIPRPRPILRPISRPISPPRPKPLPPPPSPPKRPLPPSPPPKRPKNRVRKSKSPPRPNMRYIKEGFTTDYSKDNSSSGNMNLNIVWAVLIFLLIVALIISFKSTN